MILPFIINLPLLFLIAYLFHKKYACSPLRAYYWPGLILKILSGILIGVLYTYYYGSGDTLVMQQYASFLLDDILIANPKDYLEIFFFPDPYGTRMVFFARILCLLNIITFKNYWINSFYLSVFMFISVYLLANSIVEIFKTSKIATAISFFLLPSFVFWTSGVLKETFVIGSVALIIKFFLDYQYLKKPIKPLECILIIALLYCSWQIKFYYLIVLLPVLSSYFLILRYDHLFKKKYLKFTFFFLSFPILIICAVLIIPELSFDWLIQSIYDNYTIILRNSHAEGKYSFEFSDFRPEISSFLLHAPKALIIGLFRPFLWESSFNFTFLVGFENFCILILSFNMIYYSILKKIKFDITIVATMTFVGINAIFLAYISPNWGSLTRYKTIFLPFFVLILLNKSPLIKIIESYFKGSKSNFLKQL